MLIRIIVIANAVLKSGWKKIIPIDTNKYGTYLYISNFRLLISFLLVSIKLAVNIISENFAKSDVVNKFFPPIISHLLVLDPSLKKYALNNIIHEIRHRPIAQWSKGN